MIENIKLVFENGRLNLKKTTAEKNEKALKTTIKNCINVDRKIHKKVRTTNIAELGMGLNPIIDKIIGYLICDEKIGGTIHLAVGLGFPEAGGHNESGLHWDMICDMSEAEVAIDGELFYKNGKPVI